MTVNAAGVVQLNAKHSVAVKRRALDGWRHVVKIMLTAYPKELLSETRHHVILELTQKLLTKVLTNLLIS